MNQWAARNPELYEQLSHDGYLDYFREAADMERKRQKEEGDPIDAGELLEEAWVCPTCGENPAPPNQRCSRCTASMEQDRLERESGR